MPKRYLGNIITDTPTAPTDNYETTSASGVWSLAEAFAYTKAGLWPTAGNAAPQYAVVGGGSDSYVNTMSRLNIVSTGSAADFGDLTVGVNNNAACSSATRGVFAGGFDGTDVKNDMSYITIATSGNAIDFGDLANAGQYLGNNSGCSSSTRGIYGGGLNNSFSRTNVIQYITIATTGNAADFGDLLFVIKETTAFSSSTRGVFSGGDYNVLGGRQNTIQYITIASTGNATDFGDLTQAKAACSGLADSTRGITAGGGLENGNAVNVIEYITIASTGNGTDFGDLVSVRSDAVGVAGSTSGLVIAGANSGGTADNFIDYFTIQTTGNSADWGDLNYSTKTFAGCSDSHGGLAA